MRGFCYICAGSIKIIHILYSDNNYILDRGGFLYFALILRSFTLQQTECEKNAARNQDANMVANRFNPIAAGGMRFTLPPYGKKIKALRLQNNHRIKFSRGKYLIPSCAHTGNLASVGADLCVRPPQGAYPGAPLKSWRFSYFYERNLVCYDTQFKLKKIDG
jgi:hypothetical protein